PDARAALRAALGADPAAPHPRPTRTRDHGAGQARALPVAEARPERRNRGPVLHPDQRGPGRGQSNRPRRGPPAPEAPGHTDPRAGPDRGGDHGPVPGPRPGTPAPVGPATFHGTVLAGRKPKRVPRLDGATHSRYAARTRAARTENDPPRMIRGVLSIRVKYL